MPNVAYAVKTKHATIHVRKMTIPVRCLVTRWCVSIFQVVVFVMPFSCAPDMSYALRRTEEPEMESEECAESNAEMIEEQNSIIARIIEYGDSEACLSWLDQNSYQLGPCNNRVEELTYCAAEQLIKLAKNALKKSRLEDCEDLLSRLEEISPGHPELAEIKKALAGKRKDKADKKK